jgi:hypothetical protein
MRTHAAHDRHPPFPVIVGVPRSGTTLLRFMLCASGVLAIPPETAFIPRLAAKTDPVGFLAALTAFPTWEDFGLAPEDIRLPDPFTPAGGLRAFYAAYAARHGTTRAGDKTPVYLGHMPLIAQLFPEAVFVHIIRDGRDVAASWSETWFAPDSDPHALLDRWVAQITAARAAGAGLRVHELRYEDLVLQPEATLRSLCDVIDLTFDPAMCAPAGTARRLLPEHGDRHDNTGQIVVSRAVRLRLSQRTLGLVDPGRIGHGRDVAVSLAARRVLDSLGYD